jgi:hypothetical protein
MRRRLKEAIMGSTFDIFKLLPDGLLWVTAVQGPKEVRERMALVSPGEYFMHSQGKYVVAKQAQESAEVI